MYLAMTIFSSKEIYQGLNNLFHRDTDNSTASVEPTIAENQHRYQIHGEKAERLKLVLCSLKSTSAKEDFIRTLR